MIMMSGDRAVLEALEARQFLSAVGGSEADSAHSRAGLAAATATIPAARRVFFIGNSLTDGISYSGTSALLAQDGATVTWGRQTGSGYTQAANYFLQSPLSTTGRDPARPTVSNPWGTYDLAFAQQWDAISVQPNERRQLIDIQNSSSGPRNEAEVPMTISFMRALSQNSSSAQVFVYSRPSRRTDITFDLKPTGQPFDYSVEWLKTYIDSGPNLNYAFYSRSAVQQLMPLMREAQAADDLAKSMPKVRLIPAGEAYYNIDQMIKAGRFAGTSVTSMLDFYADQSHPTQDLAGYVLGMSFYAAITGNDPRGAAVPSAYNTGANRLSDPRVVALLQQAVYDAMHFAGYQNWAKPLATDPGTITVRAFNDAD
ncbi:MAG: hypothetical protein H7144_17900, partial [Burkholderiales bacterium]|nr:hypothetical protein [Phycisphaerae bacterium]